jgi:hypothetical protein
MKTHTRFGASRERQHRREARQKFHIDNCINVNFSDLTHCSQRAKRESERAGRRDRYDISLGNDLHRVENEAVVFEYDEVNIFTSDHVDRTTNCGIGKNG